jgi:hypothetical protein
VDNQITKHSDLTQTEGDPTERAALYYTLETFELDAKLLGGNAIKLKGQALPGSPQSTANTTFLLVVGCCLVAGIAAAIGVPAMTALITGLCAPLFTYALVRVIPGRQGR